MPGPELLHDHAKAAFERRYGVHEALHSDDLDVLAETLRRLGYVPHQAVLDFALRWEGTRFPSGVEFGPDWQTNDECWETWLIGPMLMATDLQMQAPVGGKSGEEHRLVPIALGPSDYIVLMGADGSVWGRDMVGGIQATPTDRQGDRFVSRTLLWCEIEGAGLQQTNGAAGTAVADALGLPLLETLSDDQSRHWGDGTTYISEQTIFLGGNLEEPTLWTAAGSWDPEAAKRLDELMG